MKIKWNENLNILFITIVMFIFKKKIKQSNSITIKERKKERRMSITNYWRFCFSLSSIIMIHIDNVFTFVLFLFFFVWINTDATSRYIVNMFFFYIVYFSFIPHCSRLNKIHILFIINLINDHGSKILFFDWTISMKKKQNLYNEIIIEFFFHLKNIVVWNIKKNFKYFIYRLIWSLFNIHSILYQLMSW